MVNWVQKNDEAMAIFIHGTLRHSHIVDMIIETQCILYSPVIQLIVLNLGDMENMLGLKYLNNDVLEFRKHPQI